jgi:hypothetical protein
VRVRRQMLHARVLGLTHPMTGALVRVESALPADMTATLLALEGKPPSRPNEGDSRRRRDERGAGRR